MSSHGNGENFDWRPAEAALYSIRAISDYVSVVEGEIMPQVQIYSSHNYTVSATSSLLWLPMLPFASRTI